MSKKDIQNRWDEYIEELYKDDRGEKPCISSKPEGPVILKCEVVAALKAMKRRKAVGPDNIAIEMISGIEKVTEIGQYSVRVREYTGGFMQVYFHSFA